MSAIDEDILQMAQRFVLGMMRWADRTWEPEQIDILVDSLAYAAINVLRNQHLAFSTDSDLIDHGRV